MNDLTAGSLHRHLARLAGTMLFGMVFQTLYYLVDLYFVARVGPHAVAALGLCGNLMMVTIAATQALTVGTTALVAHAWGRKDFAEARRIFNQSQVLATGAALVFVAVVFALRERFVSGLAADAETARAALDYLTWFLPSLGLQFLMSAMAAALRGAGEVKAPMLVQVLAVLLNTLLAPVLIVGWGTGRPLGVLGAGLATFIAILVGSVLLVVWVRRKHDVLTLEPHNWRPDFALWRRMLAIGLPSGGEFFLMSVYAGIIYYVIRPFGATAQAGFGVGMRVLQTGFMPAVAVAFSVAPIAGQNFGAGRFERVRETLRVGLVWNSAVMLAFMAICHFFPERLLGPFSSDPAVIAAGAGMLAILSYNFLASGAVLVASGLFQALGNTLPSLLASASRILLFALPALWLGRQPGFQLNQLWWLSVVSVLLQAALAFWLLRREMRAKGC